MKEKTIKKDLKERYQVRLEKTININGRETSFREQYENANGHELESKFWSTISSSRLCFELYSWIPVKYECTDFAFEKLLPTVKSGNYTSKANMDVYIHIGNQIWFIESKFTEKPNKEIISGAYYQSLDEHGNHIEKDYTCPTFYLKAKGKDMAQNPQSLSDRFSGRDKIIKPFVKFVRYALNLQNENTSDWFDVKQEICHLLGIIMYITNEENIKEFKGIKETTINFRNIVYNKKGTEEYIRKDTLANQFIAKAQETVDEIVKLYGLNVKFTYAASSVQDLISKYGKSTSYFNDDKTVKETIIENFEGEINL